MKKLILLLLAFAMAVAMGIAAFYWTGGDIDELKEQGKTVEKQIQKAGRKSEEAAKRLKKDFLETKRKAGKEAQDTHPKRRVSKPAPTSPPEEVEPAGPPMEDINEKDKKKLEGLLENEQ